MPTEIQSPDAAGRPNNRLRALMDLKASRHLTADDDASTIRSQDSTSIDSTHSTTSPRTPYSLDSKYKQFASAALELLKSALYALATKQNRTLIGAKHKIDKRLKANIDDWYKAVFKKSIAICESSDLNKVLQDTINDCIEATDRLCHTHKQTVKKKSTLPEACDLNLQLCEIIFKKVFCFDEFKAIASVDCFKPYNEILIKLFETICCKAAIFSVSPDNIIAYNQARKKASKQGIGTAADFELAASTGAAGPCISELQETYLTKNKLSLSSIQREHNFHAFKYNQIAVAGPLGEYKRARSLASTGIVRACEIINLKENEESKLSELRSELDTTNQSAYADHARQATTIERLKEKSAQLEQQLNNQQQNNQALSSQLAESKQANATAEAQNEALTDEVQQLRQALEQARQKASRSEQLLTKYRSALATNNERLHVLTEEVQQQTDRAFVAEKKNQDLTKTCKNQGAQIERLSSERDRLTTILSESQAALERHEQKAQSQVSQLNQKINMLTVNLEQSQQSNSAITDELKQLREELDNATQQHHAAYEALNQRLQKQMSNSTSLQSQLNEARAQAHRTQQESTERSRTIETLRAELTQIRSTQQLSSDQNTELTQQQRQLETKLEEAQQTNSRLQYELNEKQATISTLQSSLANAQSEALASREELSALQSKHTEFTRAFAAQIAERQRHLANQIRRRNFEAPIQHSFGESKGSDNQSAQATTFELPNLQQITNYNNNRVLTWPESNTITKHLQNEWKIKLFNALKDYISARRKNTNQYHGFMIAGHGCGMSRTTKLSAAYKLMKIISGMTTEKLTDQEITALTTNGWSSNGIHKQIHDALKFESKKPRYNTSIRSVNMVLNDIINDFPTNHPSTPPIQVQAS